MRKNERTTNDIIGTQPINHADGSQPTVGNPEYTYRSIPYIPHLSEMVDRVFKRDYTNIRIAKYNVQTVGK